MQQRPLQREKSVYQLWCCVQKGRYRRKEPYLASSLCLWESPPSSERRGSQCARKALSWKKEPKRNRGVELTTVEERCLCILSLSVPVFLVYVVVAKLLRRREGKPSANGRGTSSCACCTEWKLKDMGPGSVSLLSGREEEWGDGGRVENKCWKWEGEVEKSQRRLGVETKILSWATKHEKVSCFKCYPTFLLLSEWLMGWLGPRLSELRWQCLFKIGPHGRL